MVVGASDRRTESRTYDAVPIACPNCKRVNRVYLPFGIAPPVTAVFSIESWQKRQNS